MRYLALIPARGGSKGVPGKNLRLVGGRPLLAWSISQALACSRINRTIVSTDDPDIADTARLHGADVPFLRPAELAADESPTEPTMVHVVTRLREQHETYDAIVLLQPTSPLRSVQTIESAIDRFEQEGADSLLTVKEIHPFLWRISPSVTASYDVTRRPRRQDLRAEDRVYEETGSVYITRTDLLMRSGNRLGGRIVLHPTESIEAIDIDSEADLWVANAILSGVGSAT